MIPPGAWTPRKFGGCVLWLRASVGLTLSGSDVTAWADQSGLGNDVVPLGTGYPQLAANAIGKMPGVLCNANNAQRFVNTTDRLFAQNAARHVFSVVRATGPGALYNPGGWLFSVPYKEDTSATWTMMWAVYAGASYGYTDSTTSVTLPASTVTKSAAIIELSGADGTGAGKNAWRVNGASKGTSAKNTESDAVGFTIGSSAYTGRSFTGYISEILAFNRVLTSAEASAVRMYLANLPYAVTVAP